jgi:hypothetical protein
VWASIAFELLFGVSAVSQQLTDQLHDASLGLTVAEVFGADAPLVVGPHLSLVPALRIHIVHRDSFLYELGSVVIHPSVSLRYSF